MNHLAGTTSRIRLELLFILAGLSLVALALATDRVWITLSPRVLFAGKTLTLTCHVPRNAHNRLLRYGIVGYQPRSERQLDGEQSRITWQFDYPFMPCGSGPAYCAVYRDDASSETVSADFELAGCDP